jgi:hypothetical protein
MSLRNKLGCAAIGAVSWLAAASASADPVTYKVFAYTDVSLNGRLFHNAAVTMSYAGDTANIQAWCATTTSANDPNCASDGSFIVAQGWKLETGTGKVRIVSGGHTYRATLSSQVIVSYDHYNGGAGFSSYVGSDHHLEPAYPLTVDGSSLLFSAPDMMTTGNWSGHAWSCVGFPPGISGLNTGTCTDPSVYPIQTDAGPLVVYQPYLSYNPPNFISDDYNGSLNSGFFSVLIGSPSQGSE